MRPRKAACAFSSIASNTGARSPGEELMTCNTSAVAVCCSNASRVSVISRAFSIAMTACAAKFCNSAICLSENGRTSWRCAVMYAEQRIVFAQRHAQAACECRDLDERLRDADRPATVRMRVTSAM